MANVIPLRGQTPSGWKRDRWAWIGNVLAAPELTPTAKLVAISMAQGFANHETAECRPGLAALMKATCLPKRTALRALADLKEAGWLAPKGGNAPGKLAAYVFRWPGQQVPTVTPEQVPTVTPEQVPTVTPEQVPTVTPEQVPNLTPTGAKSCTPPRPPYKDEPQLNHNARLHPRAALRPLPMPKIATAIIAPGSVAAERWNQWLSDHGNPPLDRLGHKAQGGWLMPVAAAPRPEDGTAYRIAVAWLEWLRSKA